MPSIENDKVIVSWPDDVPQEVGWPTVDELKTVGESIMRVFSEHWLEGHPKTEPVGCSPTFDTPQGTMSITFVIRAKTRH